MESAKESRLMEAFMRKSTVVFTPVGIGPGGQPKGRVRIGRGFDVMKRKIWWAGIGLMGCCWAGAVAGAEPAEAPPAFTLNSPGQYSPGTGPSCAGTPSVRSPAATRSPSQVTK